MHQLERDILELAQKLEKAGQPKLANKARILATEAHDYLPPNVSRTRQAEREIMNLANTINPFHMGEHGRTRLWRNLPYTFAIWNLVRRGQLRRLGNGWYQTS